jgi:putative Mg2+ transporter-C (MgtC) family protein
MTITWTTFAIRLLIGIFLAVGIGIERQWLKNRAVFKINVLVTLGSEMFMMLSIMTPDDASPTRVAAQIVSGVGFLGGGVILREGGNVIGTNTAATLWCAAAIGALVGSGFLVPAYISTFAVICANLLARPLEEAFKQPDKGHKPLSSGKIKLVKNQYCFNVICFAENETQVFELINQFARVHNLILMRMESKNVLTETKSERLEIEIKVNFTSKNRGLNKSNLEEIIKLLKTKAKVNSISLQLLSA